jgi:hypothetical protein
LLLLAKHLLSEASPEDSQVTVTRTHFAFRIDMWDASGETLVEHIAGVRVASLPRIGDNSDIHIREGLSPSATIRSRQMMRVAQHHLDNRPAAGDLFQFT